MPNGTAGLVLAAGATLVIAAGVSAAPAAADPAGLPDIAMARITDVTVHSYYDRHGTLKRGRWGLRFSSRVSNLGPGHLILHAHRAHTGTPCAPGNDPANRCESGDMTVDQVVLLPDGSTETFRGVAIAYFDPYHFHWHTRHANRYELRTGNGRRRIMRDVKSGFCFGDRHTDISPRPVEYPGLVDGLATCMFGSSDPSQDGRRVLEYTQGISAGYSDSYDSYHDGKPLEGQQFEVTKLRAGTYLLVNRANADGKIHERTRSNDIAWVRFRLSWPHGHRRAPKVRLLRSCAASPSCARAVR